MKSAASTEATQAEKEAPVSETFATVAVPATLSVRLFGASERYALEAFRSRFGSVVYFVRDMEVLDEDDLPAVIRQADTEAEAVRGLE
jgi:hypothetical protein